MAFVHNPAFACDLTLAAAERARMESSPVVVARPVIVLGGWRAPHVSASSAESLLRPLVSRRSEDFLALSYPTAGSVEAAADSAMGRIAARFPGQREFDLVGISMGGLVARQLASRLGLPAKRIFTMATPHRGATLARFVRPDIAAREMRPGSTWLAELDAALATAEYELVCYATLRDWWVGARNAAPPGHTPIWLDQETLFGRSLSHFAINRDQRILGDIARRLRGEEPLGRAGTPPPID